MMSSDVDADDDYAAELPPRTESDSDRWTPVLRRLSGSPFRARFRLSAADLGYWRAQGPEKIAAHAHDFIAQRLAPAYPVNDGKQTPMRGHPVFVAQHATATCCRGCLAKWHGMRSGLALTEAQQEDVIQLILAWLVAHAATREDEVIASASADANKRPKKKAGKGTRTNAAEKAKAQQEDEANQNRQGRLF